MDMDAEPEISIPDLDPDRNRIRSRHLEERSRFQAELRETLAVLGEQEPDLKRSVVCLLTAGIEFEKTGEYEKAAECYKQGLSCDPDDLFYAYFLHNNYGYCLNVLGDHAEAEGYCRTAIGLDPSRPNGFKNLGISLEAQSEYELAIEAWITATRVYPDDPRSLGHLEDLVEEHPDLESDLGLGPALENCRRVVQEASVWAGHPMEQ